MHVIRERCSACTRQAAEKRAAGSLSCSVMWHGIAAEGALCMRVMELRVDVEAVVCGRGRALCAVAVQGPCSQAGEVPGCLLYGDLMGAPQSLRCCGKQARRPPPEHSMLCNPLVKPTEVRTCW